MPRRIPMFAMVAALSGALMALAHGASAATGGAARLACGPPSARTIANDRVARVYASGGNAYGCAAGGTRSYRLGATGISMRAAQAEAVHLAGRVVAYGLHSFGVDTGFTSVNVRNLKTGAVIVRRSATTRIGVEGFQSIGSLVVRADGGVAWIATASAIGPPTFIRQVERVDRLGFRLLDFGRAVAPASLTLRGSTLSWDDGGTARTASLR